MAPQDRAGRSPAPHARRTDRGLGLRTPLERPLERMLRLAVLEHARAEQRRSHRPLLHLGLPGQVQATFPVPEGEPLDHALCADIVAAMRHRVRQLADRPIDRTIVWLTRPGELVLQDLDAAWLSGSRQAYGEAGALLVFVVVNRHGWWDPRSGLRRTWTRIRPRTGPTAG